VVQCEIQYMDLRLPGCDDPVADAVVDWVCVQDWGGGDTIGANVEAVLFATS